MAGGGGGGGGRGWGGTVVVAGGKGDVGRSGADGTVDGAAG